MGLLGSNNGHGATPERIPSQRQPYTSSLVSSAAERAVQEDPSTEIWDPFSGRPRQASNNSGMTASTDRDERPTPAAPSYETATTTGNDLDPKEERPPSFVTIPQMEPIKQEASKGGSPADDKAEKDDSKPSARAGGAGGVTNSATTTTSASTTGGGPMTADQLLASTLSDPLSNMPDDFLPQAMPSGPVAPARPQQPGAYRGNTQAASFERSTPLYKGGVRVLGRESATGPHENDSTRYLTPDNNPTPTPFMTSVQEFPPDSGDEMGEHEDEENPTPRVIHIVPSQRDVHFDSQRSKMESANSNKSASSKTETSNLYKIIAIVVLAVVVLVVAIVVGVLVGSSSGKSSSSNNNNGAEETAGQTSTTPNGRPPVIDQLEQVFGDNPSQVLPASTIVAIQFGPETNNPQLQAFQWLLGDPKLTKYSMPQKRQRLALASLFFATNGPLWFSERDDNGEDPPANGWLSYDLHECEWYSLGPRQEQAPCYNYTVLNNFRDQHVDYKSLVLSGNPNYGGINPALQGSLPPQVGMLSELQSLDVGHQNLKGTIPTELVTLSSTLQRIVLDQNFFSGTIPDGLYEFPQVLRMSRNERLQEGIIPTTVGRNPHLTHLGLIHTNRHGTIPPELFRVTTLVQLLFNENDMQGSLPTQIGRAVNLQELNMNVNEFTGWIPSEMGHLSKLRYFLAGGNRLYGELPSELGEMTSLEQMELLRNQLDGSIPVQWGDLTLLNHFDASGNGIRGSLPTSLGHLSLLTKLNLLDNRITGTLDSGLLAVLNESTSKLEPAWPQLEELVLGNNEMEGSLPTEIGLLESLRMLNLRSNDFDSTLPEQMSQLESLETILLEGTEISGSVSDEICSLPLETFRVECNRVECPRACGCLCA